MPLSNAFDELAETLAAWLPQVSATGNRVLQDSAQKLAGNQSVLPSWIALRQMNFCWRCQSRFDGKQTRFLFFKSQGSGREMLNAELNLQLRPVPSDTPLVPPSVDPSAIRLRLPRLMVEQETSSKKELTLKLAPAEMLTFWEDPGISSKTLAKKIRARWMRYGQSLDLGPEGDWPAELFLTLVRALASDDAVSPGLEKSFSSLNLASEIWQLSQSSLNIGARLRGWLDVAADDSMNPLIAKWDVSSFALRAGALVDTDGKLAGLEEDDTFLAPFRVEWADDSSGATLAVNLEMPDVVATDELRLRLFEAFLGELDFEDLADSINDAIGKESLKAEDVQGWCDPSRNNGVIVRVDRKKNAKFDEYLLVLTGEASGIPVTTMVNSSRTTLSFEGGKLQVELGGIDYVFSGRVSDDMDWDDGGQLLADVLSILLRWRYLLL